MKFRNLFFCGATAVLVTAAAAVGINRNSNEKAVGDVTLANVEALADNTANGELDSEDAPSNKCYRSVTIDHDDQKLWFKSKQRLREF